MAGAGAGSHDRADPSGHQPSGRRASRSLRPSDAQPVSIPLKSLPVSTSPTPQSVSASRTPPILEVELLVVAISRSGQPVRNVVDEVSLSLPAGGILALVGESGSGKTMIGRSILGLLPSAASVTGGDIRLSGVSTIGLPPAQLRKIRGGEVGMVF